MLGFAKTLLLATQLAAIASATPTVNNNNELTSTWPTCVSPTKVQVKRSPTDKRGIVETPQPTQPGMVQGCDKFCLVLKGNTCIDVAKDNHISLGDFLKWNPQTGAECRYLWANAYACVGVEA